MSSDAPAIVALGLAACFYFFFVSQRTFTLYKKEPFISLALLLFARWFLLRQTTPTKLESMATLYCWVFIVLVASCRIKWLLRYCG
jgi:Ca2+/Na+ antiporter